MEDALDIGKERLLFLLFPIPAMGVQGEGFERVIRSEGLRQTGRSILREKEFRCIECAHVSRRGESLKA